MLPILNVGPLALPVPTLAILAGIWIAIYLSERFARRFGLSAGSISNLILLMLLSGLLGARLSYITALPTSLYSESPGYPVAQSWLIGSMGWDRCGGHYSYPLRSEKAPTFLEDIGRSDPGFAALAISIGFANLASGDAFGKPTDLPWAIYLWGDYRHPTQIYEIILFGVLLGFILTNMKTWVAAKAGLLFLTFLAGAAAIHLFVEAFIGDSLLFIQTYRSMQIIAWLVLALSLWGIRERIGKDTRNNQNTNNESPKEII